MERIFIQLVNMSLVAGWLILAVLLIRGIINKLPKAFRCVMWGLVALRLICPWSIESDMSIIPKAEIIADDGNKISILSGDKELDNNSADVLHNEELDNDIIVNNSYEGNKVDIVVKENNSVENDNSNIINTNNANIHTTQSNGKESAFSISISTLSKVWIMGVVIMAVYYMVSYVILKRKVRVSIRYEKNIHLCDNISSAFILGLVCPKIYVPSHLSKVELANVIKHERAHLSRHDNWWKPLGFLLLTVYWFNPIIWIAYIMFCKDVELACDEKVVKTMDVAEVKEYSNTLLKCSISHKLIVAAPLAFGEVAVKSRIKSVLNYKKPTFWVIIVSIVISVVIAIGFMTNPATKDKNNLSNEVGENSETGTSDVTDTIEPNDTIIKLGIEEIISEAIRRKHEDLANFGNCELFDSYHIVDVEEKDGKEIYYLYVVCKGYVCENGFVKMFSAVEIPAVVTVGIDKDGCYVLEEYWEPRDGSLYGSDIRDKCPDNLEDEMFHNELYTEELNFACDRKATKYFKDIGYELISSMDFISDSEEGLDEYIHLNLLNGTCMSGVTVASYANQGTFVLYEKMLVITYKVSDSEADIVQVFTREGDTIIYDKATSINVEDGFLDYEDGKIFTLNAYYEGDIIEDEDINDTAVSYGAGYWRIYLNITNNTCYVDNLSLSVNGYKGTFQMTDDKITLKLFNWQNAEQVISVFNITGRHREILVYDRNASTNFESSNLDFEDGKTFVLIENSNE